MDLLQVFSVDQTNPGHTFESPQNKAKTRIDAIFTSPGFPFSPLYCHTQKLFLYLSDHLIVAAYFQPVESKKVCHERRIRMRRKVFNLNKMDEDDWSAFTKYSNKYFKQHNLKKLESLKTNRHNLNVLWTKIKEALITTANKTVPYSYQPSDDDLSKPKSLIFCSSALTKLNGILLRFRTKYLNRSLWLDEPTWQINLVTIQNIILEHQLEAVVFPSTLTADNVRSVKKLLLSIYKTIYQKT